MDVHILWLWTGTEPFPSFLECNFIPPSCWHLSQQADGAGKYLFTSLFNQLQEFQAPNFFLFIEMVWT